MTDQKTPPPAASHWETRRNASIDALGYAPESHELAGRILDAIGVWKTETDRSFPPTETNWRIAEALHLVTWHRPHTHAPLGLLLDEERQSASAA